MRKLLLLALLLYNVIANANRAGSAYDYENDIDGIKRHAMMDDRRNWRKKALLKTTELDRPRDFDERKNHEYADRYLDDADMKFGEQDRQREIEPTGFNGQRHYEESEKVSAPRSGEFGHSTPPFYGDKSVEKKAAYVMNCDRPHERYEACFAGCASISCDNPRERLRPCYPFCEPGCICVSPYVRDERTHKCVMPDDCSKGLKGVPDLGEEI